MKNSYQVTDSITIAGQPQHDELRELHDKGFKTVINLRTQEEDGSLHEEEAIVMDSGLSYASIPVTPNSLSETQVGRFLQTLAAKGALPAVVHCGGGGRAGIMVLMHLAITHKWTLKQALEEGETLGIAPAEDSPYRKYFESYVKQHSAGERR